MPGIFIWLRFRGMWTLSHNAVMRPLLFKIWSSMHCLVVAMQNISHWHSMAIYFGTIWQSLVRMPPTHSQKTASFALHVHYIICILTNPSLVAIHGKTARTEPYLSRRLPTWLCRVCDSSHLLTNIRGMVHPSGEVTRLGCWFFRDSIIIYS